MSEKINGKNFIRDIVERVSSILGRSRGRLKDDCIRCIPVSTNQRRAFLRLEVMIPVLLHLEGSEPLEAMCINLSGNGMQVITSKVFKPGQQLKIHGNIFGREMKITASIVRSGSTVIEGLEVAEMGLKFLYIRTRDSEHIVDNIIKRIEDLEQLCI